MNKRLFRIILATLALIVWLSGWLVPVTTFDSVTEQAAWFAGYALLTAGVVFADCEG